MKIYEVTDPLFKEYGRILEGYDLSPFMAALKDRTPMPETTDYRADDPALSGLPEADSLALSLFGGQKAEFGWCNGRNVTLNCLEYHRSSEFNAGSEDFILLLARQSEMEEFTLDTSLVKAFRVPANVLVEVYATTLHYAPCHVDKEKGFKVMVVLPAGTNTDKPRMEIRSREDSLLRAENKWLLAHRESAEAAEGAWIGLRGDNITIE